MVFEVRQIEDNDELYRRIAPNYFKEDGSISSSAYKVNGRPDREISVNLAYLTTIDKTLQDRPLFGVGSLIARYPREIELEVVHDPVYPDNEAHSLIKGACTKEHCSRLAKATSVLKNPT
jgi:hypothetical protein